MNEYLPIAVDALSAPISDAAAGGENLEYDADYLALEQALRGTPESEVGKVITAAVPPDWQAVRLLALSLFERSRDLRIAMALARALLALHGPAGLADGLALLEQLLARQWDSVHPQLEPEDDFDPMLRVNVLAALVSPLQVLRELRETPLVAVRAVGSFSLRDIELARDAAEEAGQARSALIEAAFAAAQQDELGAMSAALQAAQASLRGIEEQLARHVGVGQSLDLAPLAELLARADAVLREHLHLPVVDAPEADQDAPAPAAAVPAGRIGGRADVLRLLDDLCTWYATHEPASPVPLLLQRARRLVDKSFVELLQDLAPEGLAQLSKASGVAHES